MDMDSLTSVFEENREGDAIVWKGQHYTYDWLLERIESWSRYIGSKNIEPGTVVALESDFSPNTVALFLTLARSASIIVPVCRTTNAATKQLYGEIAHAQWMFCVDREEDVQASFLGKTATHPLCQKLKEQKSPGLIIFSSGTSGKPKAVLHRLASLLGEPKLKRPSAKMLHFLLFDHMGGLDTLVKTLSSGWTIVTIQDRSPDTVCSTIEANRVEILPVSPTFLNLLLLSKVYRNYDLSSLKTISYGSEPMPESTLLKMKTVFPGVKLRQSYGLSEVGAIKIKSRSSDSLWVKMDGVGTKYRIVDGILQTKMSSSMLGYLNAPSPFTEDGWFSTGDAVEVDGEFIRILGRKSEMINVGGEKVFPNEVESIIQELDNVTSAVVYGEKNILMGNILCARLRLAVPENDREFKKRLIQHCRTRLQAYKIPIKIELQVGGVEHSDRFKKLRVPVQREPMETPLQ